MPAWPLAVALATCACHNHPSAMVQLHHTNQARAMPLRRAVARQAGQQDPKLERIYSFERSVTSSLSVLGCCFA
eukprot:3621861-Amphidinium_carterae.1